MYSIKHALQKYEMISSVHIKPIKHRTEQKNEITRTLNEVNLIPARYDGREVYVDESKKEIIGGRERNIRVIYY